MNPVEVTTHRTKAATDAAFVVYGVEVWKVTWKVSPIVKPFRSTTSDHLERLKL
jgi:hypothetical protein